MIISSDMPRRAPEPPARRGPPGIGPAWRWLAAHPSQALPAVTLGLAALAQVRVWATGRGMWGDELAIAINLRERGFGELAGGLTFFQVAPVGWLALGKAALLLIGEDERALRLPSLVAGLVTLALVAVIADRMVGRWAAAAAVGLVGITPSVLYYAGELKQYSVETAVALGLVVAGAALTRGGPMAARWRMVAASAGFAVVAVTLSYSGLVVLAGMTAGVVLYLAFARRWWDAVVSGAAMIPAGLLGAALALHRRSLPMLPGLDSYFTSGFPEPDGGVAAVLEWLPRMWPRVTANPLYWRSPGWTLLLVATGLLALAVRGRWRWAAILGGVLAAATGAAAVHGFPLMGRVALYLVPVFVLLIVAGLAGVAQAVRKLARRHRLTSPAGPVAAAVAVATLVMLAGPPVQQGIAELRQPLVRDSGRDALLTIAERRQPGDVVVAYYFSEKMIDWYGSDAGVEVAGLLRLRPQDSPDCRPERVDALLAGARRVWYLHGQRLRRDPADYPERVLRQLADRGRLVETYDHPARRGGWALIDLTAGPDPDPPPVTPRPEFACLTVVR